MLETPDEEVDMGLPVAETSVETTTGCEQTVAATIDVFNDTLHKVGTEVDEPGQTYPAGQGMAKVEPLGQ